MLMASKNRKFEAVGGVILLVVIFILILSLLFVVIGYSSGLLETSVHSQLPSISFNCSVAGSQMDVVNPTSSQIGIYSATLKLYNGTKVDLAVPQGAVVPAGSSRSFYYSSPSCNKGSLILPFSIVMSYMGTVNYTQNLPEYSLLVSTGIMSATQR